MGEAYFLAGDEAMAAYYDKLLQAKGKENTGAGRTAWEKDLVRYREEWAEQGL